jgi:hypothetical protein
MKTQQGYVLLIEPPCKDGKFMARYLRVNHFHYAWYTRVVEAKPDHIWVCDRFGRRKEVNLSQCSFALVNPQLRRDSRPASEIICALLNAQIPCATTHMCNMDKLLQEGGGLLEGVPGEIFEIKRNDFYSFVDDILRPRFLAKTESITVVIQRVISRLYSFVRMA